MIKFITHTTFCFFLVHIVLSAVFLLPPNFTWPAVCALVCSTIFSVLQFEAKHVHLFHHDLFYVKQAECTSLVIFFLFISIIFYQLKFVTLK